MAVVYDVEDEDAKQQTTFILNKCRFIVLHEGFSRLDVELTPEAYEDLIVAMTAELKKVDKT